MVEPVKAAPSSLPRTEASRSAPVEYGPFSLRERSLHTRVGLEGAAANAFQRAPGASYEVKAAVSADDPNDGPQSLKLAFFDANGAVVTERPFGKDGRLVFSPDDVPGATSFGVVVPEALKLQSVKHTVRESGAAGPTALPAVNVSQPAVGAQLDDPTGDFKRRHVTPIEMRADSVYELAATRQPYLADNNQPEPYSRLKVDVYDPSSKTIIDSRTFGADGKLSIDGSAYPPGSILGLTADPDVIGRVQTTIRPQRAKAGAPELSTDAGGDRFSVAAVEPLIPRARVAQDPAALQVNERPELQEALRVERLRRLPQA